MTDETVAVEQCDRQAAASFNHDFTARRMIRGDLDDSPFVQAFARHRIAALASTTDREQGPPCPNCLKPVEVGQVVLSWDDAGEMHADCDRPYHTDHVQQPGCPAPVILIGDPMRQVPLSTLASAREPIAGDAVRSILLLAGVHENTNTAIGLVPYSVAERAVRDALAHPRPALDREAVAVEQCAPAGDAMAGYAPTVGACLHEWAYAPTTGAASCIRCNQSHGYDTPIARTVRERYEAAPRPALDRDAAIDAVAQFLHDEGGFDNAWYGRTWPEHPDDTGQREGGYVKIVPPDAVAHFRDVARRMFAGFPSLATPPANTEEVE